MEKACYICGTQEKDLRPYGVNMQWVCFDCGTSPENIETTTKSFYSQLHAISGPVIIGEETGPRPMFPGREQS